MTIDEKKVKVRDRWFAAKIGKLGPHVLTDDELKEVSQSLYADLQTLEEPEKNEILLFLAHTLPDAEYEGAVEYLKRTVKPHNMRGLIKVMEQDKKAGIETTLSPTVKMLISDKLLQGGFTWRYWDLDEHSEALLLEAARRFALEHPELESNFECTPGFWCRFASRFSFLTRRVCLALGIPIRRSL